MTLTHTREERNERLFPDGVHVFQPAEVIQALRADVAYAESGKNGSTLVKNDGLRVLLEVLRAGAALHEHRAPGPITVQVLEGELRFGSAEQIIYLRPGELLALPAGRPHSVEAVTDAAFLITIHAR
jgi:quercetin dioxygenase-like cupin family protein